MGSQPGMNLSKLTTAALAGVAAVAFAVTPAAMADPVVPPPCEYYDGTPCEPGTTGPGGVRGTLPGGPAGDAGPGGAAGGIPGGPSGSAGPGGAQGCIPNVGCLTVPAP